MEFSSKSFLEGVGRRLAFAFDDGGEATTPGLKGTVRELELRRTLSGVFGENVNLGTGCVISVDGQASKQQDIIISERTFGISFSVLDSGDATYFPCETTICAGEIKSELNPRTLADTFEKCNSVKTLRRQCRPEKGDLDLPATKSFRQFGSPTSMQGVAAEEFDQDIKSTDQVFYFGFYGRRSISTKRLLEDLLEVSKNGVNYVPDLLVTLDGTVLLWGKQLGENATIHASPIFASGAIFSENTTNPFLYLVHTIRNFISRARTVPLRYLDNYYSYGALEDPQYHAFPPFFVGSYEQQE